MKFGNCILMIITGVIASNLNAASPELEMERNHGAQGKVTLRVIDDSGRAVTNAFIDAAMKYSDTRDGFTSHEGYTDANGVFEVEGKVKSDMVYTVTKSDYYETTGRYWFHNGSKGEVQRGRWLPWNPVIEVILKPQKNPIPMYAKRVIADIPEQHTPIGFDMQKGDWVAPYGKGSISDFDVSYSTKQEAVHHYVKKMVFHVPTPQGGFIVKSEDEFSTFVSEYNAPTDGYMREYSFEQKRTPEEIEVHKTMRDNEYLIVRTRVVTNGVGEIVSANYSKIYGPIQYALWRNQNYLEFIYYFNPTPNDRNLEFDLDRNLFKDLSSREEIVEP